MRSRATLLLALSLTLGACASGDATVARPPAETVAADHVPTASAPPTLPADCPSSPVDITTLIELRDPAACYGDSDLSVETHATSLIGAVDCPGELEPAWFACGGMVWLYPLPETGSLRDIVLVGRQPAYMPSDGLPDEWLSAVIHPTYDIDLSRGLDALVVAVGHFDDPDAQSCHYTNWPDAAPPPADDVIRMCRSIFVITHLEPLEAPAPGDASHPSISRAG
jgi:hypothetical protein